jgi:tryptophan-rich sensory protein
LILYYAQLGLNGAWSWVFFYGQLGGFALINIAALLVVIAWLVKDSLRLSRIITLLLVPYFFWVCFAAMLNLVLWRANPGILT